MLLGFMIGVGLAVLMSALGAMGIYGASWFYPLLGLLLGYFFDQFKTKLDTTNKRLQQLETKLLKLEESAVSMSQSSVIATEPVAIKPAPAEPIVEIALQALETNEPAKQTILTTKSSTTETPSTLKALAKPSSYAPIKPIEPNVIEKAVQAAWAWIFGGNTLVRAGIIILLIGIVFLLKLAVDNGVIPVELRMLTAGLAGACLLAFGWKTRMSKPQFAWALQGGGIAVMYLVIAFSASYYHVLPKNIAFVLLVLVAAMSAIIAVKQNALPLAMLGFTGGFLAPLLASTGSGNYVALFSIYLALNIVIAFIAIQLKPQQNWRSLNMLGFAFTFVIGSIWGAKSYQPAFFSTVEPFLIAHFLLFTAIAVIYAHKQAVKMSNYVDSTLVFGTPILGFGLQYALLQHSLFGLAYSALTLGVFYIGLAYWLLTKKRDTLQFLGECFVALGIGFATLAIPLSLDGRWTSAAWAVEGVALLWAGLRQNQWLPSFAGLGLQVFGAIAFVNGYGLLGNIDNQNMFLGAGFIAISAWACGWLLHKYQSSAGWLKAFATPLAFYAWVWWIVSGFTGIAELSAADNLQLHLALLFAGLSSLALNLLASRVDWPRLSSVSFLLLPIIGFFTLVELLLSLFDRHTVSGDFGLIVWLATFGIYAYMLMNRTSTTKINMLRAPIVWFSTLLLVAEWLYWLRRLVTESGVWQVIGWAIVPMCVIAGALYWQKQTLQKTTLPLRRAWAWWGLLPLILFLLAWFVSMSLGSDGAAPPLTYLPLLNPLDISLVGILLICLIWQRNMTSLAISHSLNTLIPAITAGLSFMLLNGILLRSLHHFAGTPFEWTSIFTNNLVQVAFTLLWSITALTLMLFAHKRGNRLLWLIGAALMGLVVLKLFMLDLSARGTVERIISFIGAGLLMLVMGYFAPLPPAKIQLEKNA